MIEVATFDPLPVEAIWFVFDFPARDPFSDAFDSAGYNYQFAFENFGTATVMLHLYLIGMILCLIVLGSGLDCAQSIRQHTRFIKLKNGLFFGSTLRFLFEGYLEIVASVCIGIITIQWGTDLGWSILYCNCFTILIGIVLMLLPLYIICLYRAKINKLDDEEFKSRYGRLYDDLKM